MPQAACTSPLCRRITTLEEQASQLDLQQQQQQQQHATTSFILRGPRKKGEDAGAIKEEDSVTIGGGGGSSGGGGARQRPKSRGGRLENTAFAGLAREAQLHGFGPRFGLDFLSASGMTVKSIGAVAAGSSLSAVSVLPTAAVSSTEDGLLPPKEGTSASVTSVSSPPHRLPTLATASSAQSSSISLPAASAAAAVAMVPTSSNSKAASRLDAGAVVDDSNDDADAAAVPVLLPSHPQQQQTDVR